MRQLWLIASRQDPSGKASTSIWKLISYLQNDLFGALSLESSPDGMKKEDYEKHETYYRSVQLVVLDWTKSILPFAAVEHGIFQHCITSVYVCCVHDIDVSCYFSQTGQSRHKFALGNAIPTTRCLQRNFFGFVSLGYRYFLF
jgi:hypothetical protein